MSFSFVSDPSDKDISSMSVPVSAPISSKQNISAFDDNEDNDEDLEETFKERLIGLTEMFPECVRGVTFTAGSYCIHATKKIFSLGKSVVWIAASTAMIAVLPIMFESERAQVQDQQNQQQRELLLGPHAAVSGKPQHPGLTNLPPGVLSK